MATVHALCVQELDCSFNAILARYVLCGKWCVCYAVHATISLAALVLHLLLSERRI